MTPALALALTVSLHGLSWHDVSGYEAVNPGLGVNWRQDTTALHAGAYRNSNGRPSVYAGASFERCAGGWCAALALLAITGYNGSAHVAPLPAVGFVVSERLRLNAVIVPPAEGIDQAIGFQLEWRPPAR